MGLERNAKIEQYAEIAVRVGLNVQPGQPVWIHAPIHAPEFVRSVVRKCYEAGAKDVQVEWYDDAVTQLKYKMAPDEIFGQYPSWRVKALEENAEDNGAYLSIISSDPELLKETPAGRIAAFSKASGQALAKWRGYTTSNKISWAIVGVPSPAWAAKVFPGLDSQKAVDALWDAILKTARADGEDPVRDWQEHDASLHRRREILTRKQYRKLIYRAPGTELTVELPAGHVWAGGSAVTERGVPFLPNIPTEEVFTSPRRDGTSGYVTSTKPLSYRGNVIENFTLTFENGRVTDYRAEKGQDALKAMLEVDEGALHLGEVALVPHRSPISESNLIFYQTLYDENASCHLAIGQAFPFCLENGVAMSVEERQAAGLNVSLTHVDFMIGSENLDIDGEFADGNREPIFRKGNWAF
ncbi:aminopeptidase [Cohnella caldifontis]|uniref:aminopeptidase n=1 Tax=Cohnella caldifontis TaxID=3027471 RepID=UPI0023EAA56F|nr:aminopeptidase [Cohnella sp. YIM B05605]